MLKKSLSVLAILMLSQVAFAQKIVIIDFQRAMFETEYAQKQIEEVSSAPEMAKLKAELDSLKADLQILNKEMQSKSMTWGEEEKTKHREKVEETYRNAQMKQKQLEGQEQQVMQNIVKHYEPKIEDIVKKFVEENNIAFILRREAVAYNNNSENDITEEITAALNKLDK